VLEPPHDRTDEAAWRRVLAAENSAKEVLLRKFWDMLITLQSRLPSGIASACL
jgi:hypothetical protein